AKQLAGGDAFHQFLLRTYSLRIRQANDGKRSNRALPDSLLTYLKLKDPSQRHPFDRLRQLSRIVEPFQGIRWAKDYEVRDKGALVRRLAGLPEILPGPALAAECRRLLANQADEPLERAQVIGAILEQSPRLGEEFA